MQVKTLSLRRFFAVRHTTEDWGCVVANFDQLCGLVQDMVFEQSVQIQPLKLGFPQQAVVEVVAINVDNRAQDWSLEKTKPPGGGLSP